MIGRWNVEDPLAEGYDNISPYSYVLGNPVIHTDSYGMWVNDEPPGLRSTIVDEKGKIIEHKDDGDNSVYQLIDKQKIKIGSEIKGVDYNELIGQ